MSERRVALRQLLSRILPSDTRFVWELGCGHGHFLTAYAQAHPKRVCVGIDLVSERIDRANRKRERASLPNLHFIRAEARMFLEELPGDARLSAIYILFPDPWPKKRHHKHRIVQPEFLQAVAQRAEQGTRLFFRTDYEPYFQAAAKTFRAHPDWRVTDEPWPFEYETVFQRRVTGHHSLVARAQANAIS